MGIAFWASFDCSAIFNFPLWPDQEAPPISSSASGIGMLTLDVGAATPELTVSGIQTSDLMDVGAFSALHIDQARCQNGGVIVDVRQYTLLSESQRHAGPDRDA